MASKERTAASLQAAVDAFLSSPRLANANTRRAYAGVMDRLASDLGADRVLGEVGGNKLAEVLEATWGGASPATWNRNRAAVSSFCAWCTRNAYPVPALPPGLERRTEHPDETRALPRAAIERQLSRRDACATASSPAARRPVPRHGRARLGYDRARILLGKHTGWDLHQLRHSAATHLGEQNVPLQAIMAKTRHRNPRTAMRYIRPGPEAVAAVTELLDLGASHR